MAASDDIYTLYNCDFVGRDLHEYIFMCLYSGFPMPPLLYYHPNWADIFHLKP